MTVLGIDPGTTRIGYGVIDITKGALAHRASGLLEIDSSLQGADRLCAIEEALEILITKTEPSVVGLERLFFSKNKKTALAVAEARGVLAATVAKHKLPLRELTPNEVKLAVAGNGNATKHAVAKMVSALLHTDLSALVDDATDALAIAIAASQRRLE